MCILVSPEDTGQYFLAQYMKTATNWTKYEHAVKISEKGTHFGMSKVGFVVDGKPQYVNTLLKSVVDLSETEMDMAVAASAVQPDPSTTMANTRQLEANQCFDVTALVQEVGSTGARQAGGLSAANGIQIPGQRLKFTVATQPVPGNPQARAGTLDSRGVYTGRAETQPTGSHPCAYTGRGPPGPSAPLF